MSDVALYSRVCRDALRPSVPDGVHARHAQLLRAMWHADAAHRPTASDVAAQLSEGG